MNSVVASNVNWLILDYVAVCESRREVLDFTDFISLWIEANEIAEEGTDPRTTSVDVDVDR